MKHTEIRYPSQEEYNLFKKHTGATIADFACPIMTPASGKFRLDIIAFDDFCHKSLNYNEDKDGSLSMFCYKLGGQPFVDLIEKWM
jgi:hypothetical protein